MRALIFKNRGLLLSLPAMALVKRRQAERGKHCRRLADRNRGRTVALLGGRLFRRHDA